MLLSLLKAARESIRLAKRKEHNILRSQSVKKLSLFDGEDPPSEILRDFRRKERSDSYPLRTAQSAPQRAYPRTSVSAVCGRMERRRDGKCIFAVFRRPDASGGLKGRGQCEALRSPGTPGTPLPWPVRRRMSSKTIENERACGPLKLSQGLFRQAESASPALFSAAAARRAPLCPFCFCRSSHFRLRAAFSSRRRRTENFRLRGSE